ncbi:hypothetical protein [Hydrogenophaga sp. T2]|uniref:hypothetical protein n=1 Tax=Hydrogenophaga sp. T2 TaxID=3132823 RepID=UPI003CF7ECDF
MARDIVKDAAEELEQARESAGKCKDELFQTLALIHAAFDLAEGGGNLVDTKLGMTSPNSRLLSLLILAQDKAAAAVDQLDFV